MSAGGGGVHTASSSDKLDRQPRAKWLWLLVVLQVAIPASYYLRGDRDDERFAWRMFSAVRVQRCSVRAFESDGAERLRRVELDSALHSGWVRALERGRKRAIERFLRQRCQRPSVTSSELRRDCKDAAERELGVEHFVLDCRRAELTREIVP